MTASPIVPKDILKSAGLRATPGRIQLIGVLGKEARPLSVQQIAKKMKGTLNEVTIYRALQELYRARIVRRVNLEHDHAHYELETGREHHHHAVCRTCGYVEDIEVPHTANPEREALKRAKGFSALDAYSLDFFGLCKRCG